MKKLLFLAIAIPLFAVSQKPTVISYTRYFPKNDKVLEFQKALKAHEDKYHAADHKWRVYDIMSGPDAGGYMVIEGPTTWDQLDKRGTLGKAHTEDFLKSVMPLTTEKNTEGYLAFREDLSSVALTDYADKISISHIYPKPGKGLVIEDLIKQLQKTWAASDQSVAVYEMSSSGSAQYTIVVRYKQGLKERETDFRKPMKERFNSANGDGSFDKYVTGVQENLEHSWAELMMFNADLSSK